MARHMVANWRRGSAVALLAAVVLAGAVNQTGAQPGNGAEIHYSRWREFEIPFTSDKGDRRLDPRIARLILYVAEETGSGKTAYRQIATALPAELKFRVNTRQDGSYWFVVQTQESSGALYPSAEQIAQAPPSMKVVVDTTPPTAKIGAAQPDPGHTAAVEWTVADNTALDLEHLQVFYRPLATQQWDPLPVQKLANGRYSWNPGVAGQIEVRLQVRDKAGNETTSTANVTPTGGKPAGQGMTAVGGGIVADRPRGDVQMVNSRLIKLYPAFEEVGKSDIHEVEVWYTITNGRTWNKREHNEPKAESYVVKVDGDGRYGFILRPISGVGRAGPQPKPGDPADIWVEVDTAKPNVSLQLAAPSPENDPPQLNIRWTASDKNLSPTPITLWYSENREGGEWKKIAENLPNTGGYVWQLTKEHPFQFYVRIDAVDQASNVGTDITNKPVVVDVKTPRARIRGVEAVPAHQDGGTVAPVEQPGRPAAAPPSPPVGAGGN